MSVSPYFHHISAGNEQSILDDLTKETIFQRGFDVYYIPRNENEIDFLFGEDLQSSFNDYAEIEMIADEVQGFSGEGDFFSRFGLEIRDEVTFEVAKTRFTEVVTGKFGIVRPREGDLIMIPFIKAIFEITFTEHEQPFYMGGALYKYVIKCSRYEYTHEDIATGIDDLDGLTTETEYSDADDLNTEDTTEEITDWSETDPFSDFS